MDGYIVDAQVDLTFRVMCAEPGSDVSSRESGRSGEMESGGVASCRLDEVCVWEVVRGRGRNNTDYLLEAWLPQSTHTPNISRIRICASRCFFGLRSFRVIESYRTVSNQIRLGPSSLPDAEATSVCLRRSLFCSCWLIDDRQHSGHNL